LALLGVHHLQLAGEACIVRIALQGSADQALGFVQMPAFEGNGAQQGVGLTVAQGSGAAGLALGAVQVALVECSLGSFEQGGSFCR
jgi:hypothetical protein